MANMALLTFIRQKQKYFRPLFVVLICAYALYLRIMRFGSRDLWQDELRELAPMKASFINFLKAIPKWEHCSYLSGDHYLIYPFFKLAPNNKWVLTLPHLIATILGFYLLYLICKKYFKTLFGYLITFTIVCFNATLKWHALEIRPYAVLPTLALAAFYLTQNLIEQNTNMTAKKKWAIGIFFIFVLWFYVYGLLILALPLFYFLLDKIALKSFSILKDLTKFLLVVFCIAMPLWIFSVFGPHLSLPAVDPFQFTPNPLQNILGFLKAIFGNLVGYKKLYFLLAGIFFPFLFSYKDRLKQVGFLLIMVFLPLELIFFAAVFLKYWFVQRQFVWVMPLFAFYLGWSWDSTICYLSDKLRSLKLSFK